MTTIPVSFAHINRSRYESAIGPLAMRMFYDAFNILLAFAGTLVLRFALVEFAHLKFNFFHEVRNTELAAAYLGLFTASFLWIGYRYGLYASKPANTSGLEFRLILQSCFTAGLVVCGALYMFRGVQVSRAAIISLVGISAVTLCVQRVTRSLSSSATETTASRTIAIVGSNQFSFVMSEHIRNHPHLSYNFLGFIGFPDCHQGVGVADEAILGNVENIVELKQRSVSTTLRQVAREFSV
jgi:FlaA1/EpsC-like NDP-sugar epimerase